MKIILSLAGTSAFLLSVLIPIPAEAARTCRTKVELPIPEAGTCSVDSTNPVMGNPFAFVDTTQGCDFNFNLPGLPSLSLEGISTTLCNQLQELGQVAIDEALEPILSVIPTNISYSLEDAVQGMFEDTAYMQSNYCPVYGDDGTLISYTCDSSYTEVGETPDWATEVGEEADTEGMECTTTNGVTTCTTSNVVDTGNGESDDESLPLCSDLDSLIDSNGDIVQCRSSSYSGEAELGDWFDDDTSDSSSDDISWDY